MNGLLQDLRYALRQLQKSPGVTLAATLMLALGVGVNTAIFAVFYQVLLRTLPVRDPSELVVLEEFSKYETGHLDIWGGDEEMSFPYPAFQALRDGNQSLEDMAASTIAPATIVSTKSTDRSHAQHVSGNYFTLLGVQPVLGRLLVPDDDRSNAGRNVTVLSESYWRSQFGADRSILNRQIEINGSVFTIVGVVPHEGLMDSARPGVFIPINFQQGSPFAQQDFLDPLHRWLNIIGRLKPRIGRDEAEAQLNTIWWNWRRDTLEKKKDNIPDKQGWLQTHLSLVRGSRGIPLLQGTLGEPVAVLETLAVIILLIACANVASLLLAKAATRSHEIAVHAALGATQGRILRRVASEGLLLGAIGVCLGLLVGSVALKLLMAIVPSTIPSGALTAQLGWRTIAACAMAGVVTSLTFSVVPAILSSRISPLSALRPQSSTLGRAARLRNLLVAGEISLSFVSLSGAAVFGWSLHQLQNINPGYDTSLHMLTFRVDASMLGKSDGQVKNEYAEITQAIQRQPAVRSVTFAGEGLIDDSEMGSNVTVSGYIDLGNEPTPSQNWITPNFFSTMNTPLIAGRVFSEQDTAASQKVAIVDEAFVTHYFRGDANKALGTRFGFGGGNHVRLDIEIVGVVPTIRATRLMSPPSVPFIYLPYDQTYSATEPDPRNHAASFYVSTLGDASGLAATIRTLVHSIDRNLPIMRLMTMQDHVNGVIFENRAASTLATTMGGLALALAAIGLFGLLAFVVTQRTREIGIRIALGASREHIGALIAKRLAGLVAVGIGVGALLAWMGIRALTSRDASLAHTPIWLLVAITALLLIVMLGAAAVPARRAAKVDPMVALRYE